MPAETFVRVAGVSGFLAMVLGAYGSHGLKQHVDAKTYETGWLLVTGMLGFCGSIYHSAFLGPSFLSRITPLSGLTLMAAWLSFAV